MRWQFSNTQGYDVKQHSFEGSFESPWLPVQLVGISVDEKLSWQLTFLISTQEDVWCVV